METPKDIATPRQRKMLGDIFLEAIPKDLPADVADAWIKNKLALSRMVSNTLMPDSVTAFPSYIVRVNHGLPLEEAIAQGNYDKVSRRITEINFPNVVRDVSDVEIILYPPIYPPVTTGPYGFSYQPELNIEDVVTALLDLHLRPATLRELLALGAKQPKLQTQFQVVALGSPLDGYDLLGRSVQLLPTLYKQGVKESYKRVLRMRLSNRTWRKTERTHFAAVRL